MAVARKRRRMTRTQICLLPEELETARRMARQRGASVSQVMRAGLRREAEAEQACDDPLRDIIGMLKDGDPDGAEKHDEIIYGPRVR